LKEGASQIIPLPEPHIAASNEISPMRPAFQAGATEDGIL